MLPIVAALVNAGLGILGSAVASKGKELVEDKLGVDIDKMLGSEEGKIKLQELQVKHEEFLIQASITKKNQELEELKIEQANTASARTMQSDALKQSDVFSKRFIYVFASGWSLVSAVYVFCITFMPIPDTSIRFADTILGFLLGTIIATIINFFYGSSSSSRNKDTNTENVTKTLLEVIKK